MVWRKCCFRFDQTDEPASYPPYFSTLPRSQQRLTRVTMTKEQEKIHRKKSKREPSTNQRFILMGSQFCFKIKILLVSAISFLLFIMLSPVSKKMNGVMAFLKISHKRSSFFEEIHCAKRQKLISNLWKLEKVMLKVTNFISS